MCISRVVYLVSLLWIATDGTLNFDAQTLKSAKNIQAVETRMYNGTLPKDSLGE